MNRARALAEYVPIATFAWLAHWLPRRWALSLGRGAGRLAFHVDRSRRKVALDNLETAFGPELGADERHRIARDVFAHFGAVAMDCLLMRWRTPRDLDTLVDYEGLDHLKKAFLKGKGVFVVSGHYGNWEMVSLMQGWVGYPMAMVTRPMDNPYLERLLARGRRASGHTIISKHDAARGILKTLRRGWCVALLIDQDVRSGDRIFVDFFGRPAATTSSLGLLALRSGAPIVPVFGVPLPGDRYRITYLPEISIEKTGDRHEDILAITREMTRLIEKQTRERPEYWVWMHRRWKTRQRHEPREQRA